MDAGIELWAFSSGVEHCYWTLTHSWHCYCMMGAGHWYWVLGTGTGCWPVVLGVGHWY